MQALTRSYGVGCWRCPQCLLLARDFTKRRPGFTDYGWSVAFISDLASHSLYKPPAGKALICLPQ